MYIQEDYLNHDQSILIDLFVITLSLDNSVISLFICSFHIRFEITKYLTLIYRWNNAIQEELEDTKGVIRICKSKKDRQHNGQKKNEKRTNNDLQNITHKTSKNI
jgi:hypothetical protein